MKSFQENEKEVEDEEAEVVKEGMQEKQRPCYSQHTLTSPQNQAQPRVPMAPSPRLVRWQAGIG